MKRFVVVLALAILIFVNSSCSILTGEYIAPTKGIRAYKTDYIKKYGNTLNSMFDDEWTLKSAEEKYEECEPVCSHVDTRPQQYIEWSIEYRDGNGEQRLFVFDNRSSLSFQIEYYITNNIANYYKENFYDVYLTDVPFAPSSYVFGFFVRTSVDPDEAENREWRLKAEEYSRLLETPKGTICLSKLTPANVFEMCPIYLSINVSFSGHPDDKQAFEETVKKQIEAMTEAMNEFTNNRLTAKISMGYHEIINLEDGEWDYYWTFIRGEQVFDAAGEYFDRHAFYGYKGIFW